MWDTQSPLMGPHLLARHCLFTLEGGTGEDKKRDANDIMRARGEGECSALSSLGRREFILNSSRCQCAYKGLLTVPTVANICNENKVCGKAEKCRFSDLLFGTQ